METDALPCFQCGAPSTRGIGYPPRWSCEDHADSARRLREEDFAVLKERQDRYEAVIGSPPPWTPEQTQAARDAVKAAKQAARKKADPEMVKRAAEMMSLPAVIKVSRSVKKDDTVTVIHAWRGRKEETLSLTDVVKITNIPRSTAQRHLGNAVKDGVLTRLDNFHPARFALK